MRRSAPWAGGLLAICILGYGNSLAGPFVFDDREAIVENLSIRSLWPPGFPLAPPHDTPVAGRPVTNLSFAINHALGGLAVRGYHVANIAIHWLCALALFALVRRTLEHLGEAKHPGESGATSARVAFGAAALWAAHPLASEGVSYVTQRTESLAALFYLSTLYAVARVAHAGPSDRASRLWAATAIAACAFGMATKEVMVTAPLAALLFDASYFSGSPRKALRSRPGLYMGLAATWLLLAALALPGNRRYSAGLDVAVSPATYLANQAWVGISYLRKIVWPHPLNIDYGWPRDIGFADVLPELALLTLLVVGVLWLAWRRPIWGFPALLGLLVLAPTSSLLPIATEVGAERRMYLPLAGACVLFVAGGRVALQRMGATRWQRGSAAALLCLLIVVSLAATRARNRDFASARALWHSAVAVDPHNPRALLNLGAARLADGESAEAERLVREALRLRPSYPSALAQLGQLALERGDIASAEAHFREVVELDPHRTRVRTNLGALLAGQGREAEAIAEWRAALREDSGAVYAANNLAWVLATTSAPDLRDGPEAVRLASSAAKATAWRDPEILGTLGAALAATERWSEAVETLAAAMQLAREQGEEALLRNLEERSERYRRRASDGAP